MVPKKFFSFTLITIVLALLVPATLVAFVDPFLIYYRSFFFKDITFDNDDRFQDAGLINRLLDDPSGSYDRIIIGSSMSQNFPIDDHTLRLTFSGGRGTEFKTIVEKAIATGRVKSVLWEIYWPYGEEDPDLKNPLAPLPLYLYNSNPVDDWRYFFNHDAVKKSLRIMAGKPKNRRPLDYLYRWDMDVGTEEEFAFFPSIENRVKLQEDLREKGGLSITEAPPPSGLRTTFPNLEQNLLPVLRAHPDIHFDLYFPPTSHYGYALRGNEGLWNEMLMRLALLEMVQDLPNVSVYGFDLEEGVGNTLSTYRDPSHYATWVNTMMTQKIAAGQNQLTVHNVLDYNQRLMESVRRFVDDFMKK